MPKKLLMANEAAAYAALEAGVGVVAGYPGTPSSEVVETVAKLRSQGVAAGVHVEWSTNEKAALEVAFGASLSGARALFTCKQMGLNVASDALLSLNYVGCKGGLVLYVADDPGPISSQTEQDTRRFAAFAKVPVLDPENPEVLYAMMTYAFDLSESHGTPVIVRPTTRVCHASTFFNVPAATEARPVLEGGFKKDDSRWVIFPARSYRGHKEINDRLAAMAKEFSEDDGALFNPIAEVGEGPVLGIAAGGVSAAYVREALAAIQAQAANETQADNRMQGASFGGRLPAYRFMQVGTPYPFPEAAALRFAEGLERIVVFEELDHVLEDEFLKLAGKHRLSVAVHGKLDGSTLDRGENSTEDALERLRRFFGFAAKGEHGEGSGTSSDDAGVSDAQPAVVAVSQVEPPVRPPVLCAGCPHRGSFYAVKTALRKYRGANRAVLCGDIGCYTLGNARPLDAVDTCLCMGAGITMAQGIAAAEPGRKTVAFVGDSTFFASGLTGVANAVYNNHDITVCVLDNSTTAMTGNQPHPGTGVTLMGGQSAPIDIEGVLRALGVQHVGHANAFDLGEAKTAARKAIEFEGPSAVIFEGPCIQLSKPQAPVTVDSQACTGCSGCAKAIGCPAFGFVVLPNGESAEAASSADARPASVPASLRAEADGAGTGENVLDAGEALVGSSAAGESGVAGGGAQEGRKVLRIDESLCRGCNLCVAVCPFGAIRKGV